MGFRGQAAASKPNITKALETVAERGCYDEGWFFRSWAGLISSIKKKLNACQDILDKSELVWPAQSLKVNLVKLSIRVGTGSQLFLSNINVTSQMCFWGNGQKSHKGTLKPCGQFLFRRVEALIATKDGPTSYWTPWIRNRTSLKFVHRLYTCCYTAGICEVFYKWMLHWQKTGSHGQFVGFYPLLFYTFTHVWRHFADSSLHTKIKTVYLWEEQGEMEKLTHLHRQKLGLGLGLEKILWPGTSKHDFFNIIFIFNGVLIKVCTNLTVPATHRILICVMCLCDILLWIKMNSWIKG